MTNYCCICRPENTVITPLPPDKYGIYLCKECHEILTSMCKTYALEKTTPTPRDHNTKATGYHLKSDVEK